MSDHKCPRCNGLGGGNAFVDGPKFKGVRYVNCGMCNGSGRVTGAQLEWWRIGQQHYAARVKRGESLRECASRLGLGMAELSGMEHGRIDPARLQKDTR